MELPKKRRRRRTKNPLDPVLKETRRKKRELQKYLSEAISEALGIDVTVTVNLKKPDSDGMKKVLRITGTDMRRYYASLANAP